ncbi:MAG: NYN domain-containing protein, partial [Flavobacteriaceae bacterium]|nr:NYN domain-containing protein [Flavobacteriaceae bacterium]
MNLNLAVLIDGDNIPSAHVKEMMQEIAKYGNPTIKRIYGDWTKPNLTKWKNLLLENAITPIQQYGYTTGKNATDSAMIIDAMDILYSEKVNGFCLVSSDSDFTRLATRLREAGMQVIGIGEKKTPNPFIVACDKFIYIEIIRNQSEKKEGSIERDKTKESLDKITRKEINLISTTISDLSDEDG